jgi:hypothetical protein
VQRERGAQPLHLTITHARSVAWNVGVERGLGPWVGTDLPPPPVEVAGR